MEYVVERFHGRSLALAHSQEEIEELDLRNNDDTLTEEKFVYLIYRISHSKRKFNSLVNLFDIIPIVCENIE
jgi:hypothetical protein